MTYLMNDISQASAELCSSGHCGKVAEYWCASGDGDLLWFGCKVTLHADCQWVTFVGKAKLAEAIWFVDIVLKTVARDLEEVRKGHLEEAKEEFIVFEGKLSEAKEKVIKTIQDERHLEYAKLAEEVLHVRKHVLNSFMFAEYAKFKADSELAKRFSSRIGQIDRLLGNKMEVLIKDENLGLSRSLQNKVMSGIDQYKEDLARECEGIYIPQIKLGKSQLKSKDSMIENLQTELLKMKDCIINLEIKLDAKNEESELLKQNLSQKENETNVLETNAKDQSAQLMKEQQSAAKLSQDLIFAQNKLVILVNEITDIKSISLQKSNKVTQLSDENKDKAQQIQTLISTIGRKEDEVSDLNSLLKVQAGQLNDKTKELSSKGKEIADQAKQIKSLQKEISSRKDILSKLESKVEDLDASKAVFKQCPELVLNTILKNSDKLDQNYELIFKLSEPVYHKLLGYFKHAKMPKLKHVRFSNVDRDDNNDIVTFWANSIKQKIKTFYFNTRWDDKPAKTINLSNYIGSLSVCLPRVSNEVCIHACSVTSEHVNKIIKACWNTKKVWLSNLTIKNDQPFDFSTASQFQTELLVLKGTGDSTNWDWAKNVVQFKELLTAISQSGLKDSLKEINVIACGMKLKDVQATMEDLSLGHIKASDNVIKPGKY